ncbi:MAG TPA: hypothetical protein VIT65_14450 [Microlunatus sp.]
MTTMIVTNHTTDPQQPVTTETATSTNSTRPVFWYALIALVVVGGCVWLASFVFPHPAYPPSVTPASAVEGLTIFAVFFVGAQALERLLEPVALVLNLGGVEKAVARTAAKAVQNLAAQPGVPDITDDLQKAVDAKADDQKKTAERTIVFWGIATGLAALASGTFGFYFLSTVGIPVPEVWMEILGTALIIGSGTKPLHDLISMIEKKKEAAAVAATT